MSLKKRLIPVLLLKNEMLVRSELFKYHQIIGNPLEEVERFNEWNVDELIYLDITNDEDYNSKRADINYTISNNSLDILKKVSKSCFMPLTWGGKIKNLKDMEARFRFGADKITINSEAIKNPDLIKEASKNFGNQAIVVSIDVNIDNDNNYRIYSNGRKVKHNLDLIEWVKKVEDYGAGEILLQCINLDGTGKGYDVKLINLVSSSVNIPVIGCSGAGSFEDYAECINAGASAAAAANIWHFKELSDREGKRALKRANIDVRI
tara:strand:- start:4443 stop:5234 length:792 start_codon:yes stop_codon:yes gene_type:complete